MGAVSICLRLAMTSLAPVATAAPALPPAVEPLRLLHMLLVCTHIVSVTKKTPRTFIKSDTRSVFSSYLLRICVGIAAVILSSNQNMSPVQVLQMMLRYATRHAINFLPLTETHRLITPNLVAAVPVDNRKGQWITAETCTQACLHYFQRQQQSKALPKRLYFFCPQCTTW